ncbi:MAG: hypothetical protein JXR46_02690 [Calditrichaceae bacterium]|nr:hypothetical protein [Calditrichaceae bacterium]MBN2707930.1 hypothetical protein [Calditrichaceae bacterium]RQV95367.1 MAG: hypothetical protein EH224_07765 [Calditrichota bacterium]
MKFIGKIFLLLIPFIAFAQEQRPLIEVQSIVDTSVITIGDRIVYSIIIDRAEHIRIEKPGEGLNLGMFEIKDYNFHEPEKYDGRIREQFDFNISVFDTGKFVIPAYPVAYFLSDTSRKFHLIEASPIDIYVKSLLSGDEEHELKDIKGPLEIPFNYIFWVSIAATIILALLILYIIYNLWKKRKEQGYLFSPPPPPVPAHVAALKALEELFASDLLERDRLKEYFSRLSDIIRIYIEGRYEISALEETTMEILRDMDRMIPEPEIRRNLLEILSLSDLVKFAKHHPDRETIDQAGKSAVDFVECTRPVYESEKNGQLPDKQDETGVTAEDTDDTGSKLSVNKVDEKIKTED